MDANGPANGNSYRRRAREARARVAALRAEAEARLLESWGVEPQPGYPTSWYGPFDAGRNWGLPPAWLWHGGRDARQDGADRPFVWHEVDLDRGRGLARWLATKNLWAVGTLNTLVNYAVKTGYKWECVPAAGMEQDRTALVLARLAQRVIDEFADLNTLPFWEREAFTTSRRDGECFYRFFTQDDGTTLLRPVLPEQVRQPLGSPASCTFGIETDPRDVLRPLTYYVDYEAGAPDGYARDDYEDVPADEMAHLKLNVDAVVKRGLSDFYCCHESFDELSKLLRNMRITAGIQSAVAWYERFPTVATDTLGGLAGARRDLNRPPLTDPLSGRQLNYERFEPGQVRLINGNREFIPAPLAQNTTQHISILQACLRALGRRWDMPEYMASGDASNANYASTLVAGSPFVNAVECEQARYLVHFRRWQMAALKNAAAAGRFQLGGRAWAFEDVMRLVAVHGTPPAVAVANRQAEAMQDLQDLAAGVTSLQVVRGKRGLDSAKVEQDLREQPPTRVVGRATDVDPSGNPVGPGGGVRESLLREGFTGVITDSLGRKVRYVDGRRVKGPAPARGKGGTGPPSAPAPPPAPALPEVPDLPPPPAVDTSPLPPPPAGVLDTAAPIAGRLAAATHLHEAAARLKALHEHEGRLGEGYKALVGQADVLGKEAQGVLAEAQALADSPGGAAGKARYSRLLLEASTMFGRASALRGRALEFESERQKVRAAARDALKRMASAETPTAVAAPLGRSADTPGLRAAADAATGFLGGLVGKGPGGEDLPRYYVTVVPGKTRAHYEDRGHTINAGHGGQSAGVIAHEIGHGIEYKMPGAQAAAQEFVRYRLGGEAPVKLKDVFPGGSYGDDETGARDDFGRVFDGSGAYYVGKTYPDGGTEVVAMGVQALYEDPARFAAADPEYFAFTLGVLRGELRNAPNEVIVTT
jgi:hypothetical protein